MLQVMKMEQNPPPSYNERQVENVDFKIELVISETAEVYLFHSEPFHKPLSWVEFDLDSKNLDFILLGGDVRNFGARVPEHLAGHMQNAFQVTMVELDETTGEPVSGQDFPLIIHRK